MRLAIIGRSEYLYESARLLLAHGHQLALIVTSKEAPEYLYKASDFEALAEESGAKFLYTPKINSESIVQQITALGKIDLAVSINYAGVIAQEVIDLFPMGILNAHGGDLPRYRGNACMAWAILNHENRVGLCIHKMIGGELDSGDVLARKHLPIDIDTRVGQTFEWMRREIPGMMLEAVQRLQADPLQLFEQQSKNPVEALRTYPRLPEDGCIDWNRSTEDVLRLINASSEPFSGAFCDLNGQRMIVKFSLRVSMPTARFSGPAAHRVSSLDALASNDSTVSFERRTASRIFARYRAASPAASWPVVLKTLIAPVAISRRKPPHITRGRGDRFIGAPARIFSAPRNRQIAGRGDERAIGSAKRHRIIASASGKNE